MFEKYIEEYIKQSFDDYMNSRDISVDPNAFTDTRNKAVLTANALGIVNGMSGGKFEPFSSLTRAQMAVMINRTANAPYGFTHKFTDVIGHWVDSELGWPSSVGIINGVGNNRFNPDGQLTTEQAIAMTYRLWQVLHSETPNTLLPPPALPTPTTPTPTTPVPTPPTPVTPPATGVTIEQLSNTMTSFYDELKAYGASLGFTVDALTNINKHTLPTFSMVIGETYFRNNRYDIKALISVSNANRPAGPYQFNFFLNDKAGNSINMPYTLSSPYTLDSAKQVLYYYR